MPRKVLCTRLDSRNPSPRLDVPVLDQSFQDVVSDRVLGKIGEPKDKGSFKKVRGFETVQQ